MQKTSLFKKAQDVIPGGVNSPVRAFKGVGGEPIFIAKAHGAYMTDSNGKHYVDYVGSWGPMILGHADADVINAVKQQAELGLSYGAPTELEVLLAMEVCKIMPSIEKIRMVNSGTEATMSAIRLARAYTKRDKFIKFEGCYHGHADNLLVKAGSGALTCGEPSSPGVPADTTKHTLTCAFNDFDEIEQVFATQASEIAAIIIEPIAGNMNMIKPKDGYLQHLRALCDKYGSVLIFDEVMTGFRVGLGGAQELYNIVPDLTTLGKVVGGGMPVGAFGGKAEIMDLMAPIGPVYQAGTLSGNPLAMAAGLATLRKIQKPGFYAELAKKAQQLTSGLQAVMDEKGIPFTTEYQGGMFGLFFNAEKPIDSFAKVMQGDIERFKQFFHHMLAHGVYLAPSAFEAGFVSAAHTETDIAKTIATAKEFALEISHVD